MNARNRPLSFLREAAFGFVVSVIAAALATTLAFVLPVGLTARALVAGLGLTLVLRTLAQSGEKSGRIVTMALWFAAAAAAWLSGIGFAAYVALHLLIAWLVRALYLRSRLTEAALDLGLAVLAASFAIFAAQRTGSVFLASWSFLLVHALGAGVPAVARVGRVAPEDTTPVKDPNADFDQAAKAADEALARIAARRA